MLIVTTIDSQPEDFRLLAQNMRTYELCGLTEHIETWASNKADEIPHGFEQRVLPGHYGEYLTLAEIETLQMIETGEMKEALEIQAGLRDDELDEPAEPDEEPPVESDIIKSARRQRRRVLNIEDAVDPEAMIELKDKVDNVEGALVSVFGSMAYTTESMRIALFNTPWQFIPEWEDIPGYDFFLGQAVRVSWNKYVFPDGGRLNPGQTPATSPSAWLVRDMASFDPDGEKRIWTKDEFCLRNVWRWDESSNQDNKRGWFMTIKNVVHGSTPPPNDEANWAFMGTEDPPS